MSSISSYLYMPLRSHTCQADVQITRGRMAKPAAMQVSLTGVWKVKAAAPRPRDAIVARQQPAKIIFTRLCSHVEHIHICIIFYMLYDIILYLICLILC